MDPQIRQLRNPLPPLDPGLKEALQAYISRREQELAGQTLYD